MAATLDPGSSGGEFHYGLAGRSPAIRKVRQLIPLLAGSRETVLILGETGTGKELVARALHGLSPTRAGPFVAHNMAATPSELAESVFFGHARGAFSGATADHLGLFEQAEGGTLFLDEVDSFPLGLQAKLLRILECARFHRVGSGTERKLDVRVIAASATELSEAVARGVFRADLYYRLRQLELRLPPLRDRREDILELVEQFVTELAHESGRRVEVSLGATDVLRSHLWPGNCRELRNAVRGATMLAGPGPVLPGHLAAFVDSIVAPDAECATGTNLRLSEHLHILDVLERARGNQSRAARLLGIDRGTLARKLKALKLEGSTPTTRDVEGSEPAGRP